VQSSDSIHQADSITGPLDPSGQYSFPGTQAGFTARKGPRATATGATTVGGTHVGGTTVGGTTVGGTTVGGTTDGGTHVGGTHVGGTQVCGTTVGGTHVGGTHVGETTVGGTEGTGGFWLSAAVQRFPCCINYKVSDVGF
jgi:hypothetical protein